MKVMVTGGTGFIGSYTVDNLLANGHAVILFDRRKDRMLSKIGTEHFLGDVRDFVAVNEAVSFCDAVVHCAAVLGTAETINEPRPAVETNIYGSLNVFQACRNYGKKCCYITVGNYWMNNTYSITKTTAENVAWMFNKEHGTEISIVRALDAYGPGQKDKPVRNIMPNFVIPALLDQEITVYGDGSQIMDMIYVADVADVLVRTLTVPHNQYTYVPLRGVDNTTKFDAGTGRSTSVQEIAQMVIDCVGKGRVNNVPMRPGEPEKSVVLGDPETLRPLYGGDLPDLLPLEAGIEKTVAYYHNSLKETGRL